MNMINIIEKKKNKERLTKEELAYAVMGYVNEQIPDYQMSSLLMAIVLNGMTQEEILDLTDIMIKSGDQLDLSSIEGVKVDKHSTGGIGDKTTIAVLPLVASAKVKCAKMSGRGLGFTGGTIDKLESIPGFQTKLEFSQFMKEVNTIGLALMSQTGNLCPADKKIYALRDVTATTESIPLIASSIMSKKIASGADKIVIDVKVGNGALMKTLEDAKLLAKTMIEIGKHYQKEVVCLLTNMEQPLGYTIGNRLEVEEAIALLKGEKSDYDFKELVISLATYMVHLGCNIDINQAHEEVVKQLDTKAGFHKLLEFIEMQGGRNFSNEHLKAREIYAPISGYIKKIYAEKLGTLVKEIGGGRENLQDQIDYEVGVVLNKKVGDFIQAGELLLTVYENKKIKKEEEYLACFEITEEKVEPLPLIYEIIK